MPTKLQKLLQASEAANAIDSQHILLSISADGKVSAAGSDSLVTGMVSDIELYNKLKDCIKNHVSWEAVGYATTHTLAYAPLPCSPSSALQGGRSWALL